MFAEAAAVLQAFPQRCQNDDTSTKEFMLQTNCFLVFLVLPSSFYFSLKVEFH